MPLTWRRRGFPGICVDLTGGLGNQLFGFAAGWTQARRLGVPLALRHRRRAGETPRSFELQWLLAPPQVELSGQAPHRKFREASSDMKIVRRIRPDARGQSLPGQRPTIIPNPK